MCFHITRLRLGSIPYVAHISGRQPKIAAEDDIKSMAPELFVNAVAVVLPELPRTLVVLAPFPVRMRFCIHLQNKTRLP